MDASSGGAVAAEIIDMNSGEEEDSSSTCTEDDNNHVSKLNAKIILVGSWEGKGALLSLFLCLSSGSQPYFVSLCACISIVWKLLI